MDKLFPIPVMAPIMTPPKREYPISPRENLLRACRREKPLWMPTSSYAIQWASMPAFRDMPMDVKEDSFFDWFGVKYKYEKIQQSPTAINTILPDINLWRETIRFPDLSTVDWAGAAADVARDASRALAIRLGVGIFERLHFFEGFEQALCDILLEQEECKALFNRLGQYKAEVFQQLRRVLPLDIICHNDDWSNARAPFFSDEVFRNTLLDSAVELAHAVHQGGCYFMAHCCGFMEAFLPYLVNDIHADILEIQSINNIRMILDKYSEKTTPLYSPDPYIMYDPTLKPEDAQAYARRIVDQYGAHTCDGAGVIVKLIGSHPETYYAFEDELFHYSIERYQTLQ